MSTGHREHIVLFPFLAQGHIRPFLSLWDRIHRHNPDTIITLVSTTRNIQFIRASLPSNCPLNLHSLPFYPESYGLPPNADSTAEFSFQLLVNLFRASESLQPSFEDFIAGLNCPVYIITDFFLAWTADVAKRFNALHSVFLTMGAYATAVYFSLWTHVPLPSIPSDKGFPLPEFPHVRIHNTQCTRHLLASDGKDVWSSFIQRQIKFVLDADVILINTVEGLESTGLKMIRGWFRIPICPIGPLLLTKDSSSSRNSDIMEWLDSKSPASVLYISFGSLYTLQAKQMMELALGLEASGRPFVWVVRPPAEIDVNGEFKAEWLPERFEERMKHDQRGLLVHGWAPQVDILAHRSTSAFLSHCGWNSILESLSYGVPIIAWPLSADQFYNAKNLVEELGVSLEVARGNNEYSIVESDKVKEAVEIVMGDNEKGKEMRNKAMAMREVIKTAWKEDEGSSEKALAHFFQIAAKSTSEVEKISCFQYCFTFFELSGFNR